MTFPNPSGTGLVQVACLYNVPVPHGTSSKTSLKNWSSLSAPVRLLPVIDKNGDVGGVSVREHIHVFDVGAQHVCKSSTLGARGQEIQWVGPNTMDGNNSVLRRAKGGELTRVYRHRAAQTTKEPFFRKQIEPNRNWKIRSKEHGLQCLMRKACVTASRTLPTAFGYHRGVICGTSRRDSGGQCFMGLIIECAVASHPSPRYWWLTENLLAAADDVYEQYTLETPGLNTNDFEFKMRLCVLLIINHMWMYARVDVSVKGTLDAPNDAIIRIKGGQCAICCGSDSACALCADMQKPRRYTIEGVCHARVYCVCVCGKDE